LACAEYIASVRQIGLAVDSLALFFETADDAVAMYYLELGDLENIFVQRVQGDIQNQLCAYLNNTRASHSVITSDGCVWTQKPDFENIVRICTKTHACTFSFYLGLNTKVSSYFNDTIIQPNLINVEDDYYVWKYAQARGEWFSPYTTYGVLYQSEVLQRILPTIKANTIAQLQQALLMLGFDNPDDVGLCAACAGCEYNQSQ
jgi:hypothetical protein